MSRDTRFERYCDALLRLLDADTPDNRARLDRARDRFDATADDTQLTLDLTDEP